MSRLPGQTKIQADQLQQHSERSHTALESSLTAVTLFDKVSYCPFLADIFHPFMLSPFYFLALPGAQMTNTKAASSLLIPLLLLRRCDVKHLKKRGRGGGICCRSKIYLLCLHDGPAGFISVSGEGRTLCMHFTQPYFSIHCLYFVVMYNVG